MEDIGEILDKDTLTDLLDRYKRSITCVCFMGGDANPEAVDHLSLFIKESTGNQLKTAWYSGKTFVFNDRCLEHFNYIKLGPYIEELGGLDSPFTNQRFYKIENGEMVDQTKLLFQKSHFKATF